MGLLGGSIGDLRDVGVTDEFVADITTALTPGKAAVVAHIVEEWMTPLDTRMESIDACGFRDFRRHELRARQAKNNFSVAQRAGAAK